MALNPSVSSSSTTEKTKSRGGSLVSLVTRAIEGYKFHTIFDVGANTGQTVLPLSEECPEARIFSFEPVPATFSKLEQALMGRPNLTAVNAALGACSGEISMVAKGTSTTNRVVSDDFVGETVRVPMLSGAEAFEKFGVTTLSLLKIDAEGYDLRVLDGFIPVLDRIDFIQVEAGMNEYNKTHVPFFDFYHTLTRRGFMLFMLMTQRLEFKRGGRPVLRRTNPVFINSRLVELQGIS